MIPSNNLHLKRRLYNKENKLTSNPKEIINELQGFYENLYHENSNTFLQETEQVFLQSQSIPKLNEEERNSCEGYLPSMNAIKL